MEAKERKAALRAAMRTLTERAVRAREQERLQLQARRRSAPAPPPRPAHDTGWRPASVREFSRAGGGTLPVCRASGARRHPQAAARPSRATVRDHEKIRTSRVRIS